ncbi:MULTISPECIES: DUF402 domain-containing protein [unclassified Streptomyces]|uniref:DUF402 domain-containing protein n=1 Tax=unclassified Streptomyces TaxID=2593676 RepID=UPI00168BB47F|nr:MULTISPECIES: DUF402 domain-containing protein [unclassified Streptomyces]MBD3005208.1 DUF402 domain-containing protein [Streptomyces sp. 5-10]
MPDLVSVNYRKYDGTLHWNLRMRRLGEDDHGVWLGLPGGGVMRKGYGPMVPIACAHVILIPRDAWWTAAFNAPPRETEIYCDIATPAEWRSSHEVSMVDLDLDVLRKRTDGSTLMDDEDEFAEHQVRYGYPADVIAEAEAAGRWLMDAVDGRAEPFGDASRAWLAMVDGERP